MKLIPHHQGIFNVFRTPDGVQYGRLEFTDKCPGSYVWFIFNYFDETYQSLENELSPGDSKLKKSLEEAYQKCLEEYNPHQQEGI